MRGVFLSALQKKGLNIVNYSSFMEFLCEMCLFVTLSLLKDK